MRPLDKLASPLLELPLGLPEPLDEEVLVRVRGLLSSDEHEAIPTPTGAKPMTPYAKCNVYI